MPVFRFLKMIILFQVQAEVKKAWLRRSLTLDLKQKARITSSGGGSCYYGGMVSHATTHSVCLPAANPRAFAGDGSVVRPARHASVTALHPHYVQPGNPQERRGSAVLTRNVIRGKDECKSHGSDDPDVSSSLKEIETPM